MKKLLLLILILLSIGVKAQTVTEFKIGNFKFSSMFSTDVYKIVISLPNGKMSYMDADSCWHITDTISTLNMILKCQQLSNKAYNDRIDKLTKIINSEGRILSQLNTDGSIEDRHKFQVAVMNFWKLTNQKPVFRKKKKQIKHSI